MAQSQDIDESLTPESSDSEHQPTSSSKKKPKPKQRLSAVQKNTNHKDAENKRRNAIRERFTELSAMVPGTQGQERSEQVMLQKTSEFLQRQLAELRHLEIMADRQGINIDEHRLKDSDYGGARWKHPAMDDYRQQKAKKEKSGVQTATADDDEG